MGWVPYAIMAVATVFSANETRKAGKEQRKANNEQRAQNAADAARERRMQMREARIRRATLMQGASALGVEESSGEIGALGSISTTLSSNVGANLGRLQTATNISIFQQNAADALNKAETARAVGQLASIYTQSKGK